MARGKKRLMVTTDAERAAKDLRHRALGSVIAEYEAQHGVITDEEMVAQRRADEKAAIVVRGQRSPARFV